MYMGPQYGLCFMSPFWHLEFCGGFQIFKKLSRPVLWSYNLYISCHFFVPSEIIGIVLLLHKYVDSLYMILHFNDDGSETLPFVIKLLRNGVNINLFGCVTTHESRLLCQHFQEKFCLSLMG